LQSESVRCAGCGDEQLIRVFRPNNTRERQRDGVRRLISEHHCPVCGAQHNLSIFGARAASLASVAIHHGYASPYNDDKKLIAFSDSVQDAAHRAGFFNARTWRNNIRMAMVQAFAGSGRDTVPLNEFYDWLPAFWRDPQINPQAFDAARFVVEFIAPNMLWYRDYQNLCEHGALPEGSKLVDEISQRLHWEVLAEFGYRSRTGRTLERTATMALGIELEPVYRAAAAALTPLSEQLG
jgi:DEAD/DEAH box helicase domain-containing protein